MTLQIQHRKPDLSLQLPEDWHPVVRRILQQRRLRSVTELDLSLENLLPPAALQGI